MPNYTFRTYAANSREYYTYGETGSGAPPLTKKDLPFSVGLMRMLYLDMHPFLGMPAKFDHAWRNLIHTREEQYSDEMRGYLDELAQAHFFFEVTRLEWYDRLRRAAEIGYADKNGIDILDLLPRKRVTHIPSEIFELQRRGLALIEAVMDIDRKDESFQKRLVDYYPRNAKEDLSIFTFRPCPVSYELIDGKEFAEVLYPKTVYDLIDYYLRQCVQRELRARECKHCGHWFMITTRSTAEYCDVTLDERGHTCKERGAIKKWTERKSQDDVFKEYRREYKRRFSWIRAGRISEAWFYNWSAEARKQKAKCDSGEITFEEFKEWLGRP